MVCTLDFTGVDSSTSVPVSASGVGVLVPPEILGRLATTSGFSRSWPEASASCLLLMLERLS